MLGSIQRREGSSCPNSRGSLNFHYTPHFLKFFTPLWQILLELVSIFTALIYRLEGNFIVVKYNQFICIFFSFTNNIIIMHTSYQYFLHNVVTLAGFQRVKGASHNLNLMDNCQALHMSLPQLSSDSLRFFVCVCVGGGMTVIPVFFFPV